MRRCKAGDQSNLTADLRIRQEETCASGGAIIVPAILALSVTDRSGRPAMATASAHTHAVHAEAHGVAHDSGRLSSRVS